MQSTIKNKILPVILALISSLILLYTLFWEVNYSLILAPIIPLLIFLLMKYVDRINIINYRKISIQPNSLNVKDNILIVSQNNVFKGVAVYAVNEIPYSYSDVSQTFLVQQIRSFTNFITSIDEGVSLVFIKKKGSIRNYIRSLERTITNYKVLLSADPTNPHIQRRLRRLEAIYERISKGESSINISIYLTISAEASSLKRLLEILANKCEATISSFKASLGLDIRKATSDEVLEATTLGMMGTSKPKTFLERDLAFLTPIGYVKRPRTSSNGIYIGDDIDYGAPVFYDFEKYLTKHVVIIGPTGRGKTTLLYTMAKRVLEQYNVPIWILDLKGEFIDLKKTMYFEIVDPKHNPLNLLLAWFTTPRLRAKQFVNLVKTLSELDSHEEYILYMSLLKVFERSNKPTLTMLVNVIKEESERYPEVKYKVYSLLSKIEVLKTKLFMETSLAFSNIVKKPIIFALYKLPEEYRKLYALAILQILTNYMLSLTPTNGLRHFVIIDEAWRLMESRNGAKIIKSLIKEGRGYGLAVALASQDITDFPKEVVDNAGTVIVFGSNSKDYIESVAKYMKLNDEEKERMTWLKVGEALIRIVGDPRPIWVKVNPEPLNIAKKSISEILGIAEELYS